MSVELLAVAFNHDPSSAAADALNIRRNVRNFVEVPEWRRGATANPEDSPAAYSIEETRGRRVTVKARFFSDEPQLPSVSVRAVQAPAADPFIVWLRSLLQTPLRDLALLYLRAYEEYLRSLPSSLTNVLGELGPREVTFDANGESDFEAFECVNHQLGMRGVGVHTVAWRWQYSLGNGVWIDFDESRHRIYTIMRMPRDPWEQFPYEPLNTQLPWADVLDYACRWAQSAFTPDDAAARLAATVYGLGRSIVKYDCPGGGGTHYTEFTPRVVFDCTSFIGLLNGRPGHPPWVNCIDCATIVSTFGNILGCDLSQSGMFSDTGGLFETNEVLAIGSNVWQTPCGWPGFGYHEVAWKGECTERDAVFDACLLVNGNSDPTRPPHIPLLPANIRFGFPGDGQYRDRLATPVGRPKCDPQPLTTRRRRPVI